MVQQLHHLVTDNGMLRSKFNKLRYERIAQEERQISLREIAKGAGLSVGTIHRISSGDLSRVNLSTIESLCRYFGVKSLTDLVEYIPDEQAS